MPVRKPTSWLVLPLLWLGAALRFFRLDAQSFWNDEGNSARLAERSLALIIEGAAGDVHPPLYYLLLAGWRALLGDGEFALRALSAFAGVLLVAGVFGLGQLLYRRRRPADGLGRRPADGLRRRPADGLGRRPADGLGGLGLLAGLFAAVHPALVYYSQEARMYALLGLWAVLGTLMLWRLLPLLEERAGGAWRVWAAGYLGVVVAGLYSHYFFPVVLVVHNLVVLLGLLRGLPVQEQGTARRRGFVRWAGIMVAALLLYLPWLPIFLRQTGGRAVAGVSAAEFGRNAGRWLVLGETIGAAELWLVVGGVWFLVLVGMLSIFSEGLRIRGGGRGWPWQTAATQAAPGSGGENWPASLRGVAVILFVLAPPLAVLLLGATRPAYHKFLIVAPPFLALLAARGVLAGWVAARHGAALGRWALRGALLLLAGLVLWGSGQSLHNLYFDAAFARADYRGIAARIEAEGHMDAGVILNAANQWEVFTYYHDEGAPVYPLPRGQPDAQRIADELEGIAAQHERLYAVFWGEDERDPQRLVERWLDAHAFKAREEWVGDVRFVTYAVPPEPTGEMAVQSGVRFGQAIVLEGYTVQSSRQGGESEPAADDSTTPEILAVAGDIVQVTLFWRATQPLGTRYKIFLHLIDEQGRLAAQRDAEPVGNLAPTTTWQPGETVVDNHGLLLPAELAPGRYTLHVGLYPWDEPGARLAVSSVTGGAEDGGVAPGVSGDSLLLGSIAVR